jgi:hypothetical protein
MYSDTKLLNKYNLCGIHPRVEFDLKALQKQVKIPLFIMAQHEGGMVNEKLLKLSTQSAYAVGREFERLAGSFGKKSRHRSKPISLVLARVKKDSFKIRPPKGADYDKAIFSLLVSMDKLIELFSELKQKRVIFPPNPNYFTPLTVNSDNSFELKPFNRLPVVWLRSFSDEDSALQAYSIFKNIYQEWMKKQVSRASGINEVVSRLISLREQIKKTNEKK